MSSLAKMLSVLDLFGPQSQTLEAGDIEKAIGQSRATTYRYIKELVGAGLLSKLGDGYALGPRIIELDWMMREYDPLILNGQVLMRELSERIGLVTILSVFYNGHVINTHLEQPNRELRLSFGRGRPLPIFKGAQSKVLIAHQKGRRLKQIFERFIAADPAYSYDWSQFSTITRKIRQDGYCETHDELNMGLSGIAAPIFDEEKGDLLGCLAAVGETDSFEMLKSELVSRWVIECAVGIGRRIREQ